jgi:cytochrome c oxidase cbb3-type subunit 3
MYLFVATSIFGFTYLALYPALGTNEGAYGWSSKKQYEQEVEASRQQIAPIYAKFAKMSVENIAKDEKAMAIGERLFMNNCSMCHGSDAHGSRGFPNLTDKDWLHGGEPKNIIQTITNGRNGMMPPMAAAVGSPDDVKNVANYVLSLSGAPHDMNRAALGKPKFAACAACHGAEGKGNTMIGAPNLSDNIWLHGYGEEAIIERINHGKQNQMPAQKSRLTPEQIRVLAAYVWRFSNMPEAAKMDIE